jgi:hypothetical protein
MASEIPVRLNRGLQPTPAPTPAKPDGPSHDEPESQTDVERTGTKCSPGASHLLELSSMSSVEQPDDEDHVASSLGKARSAFGLGRNMGGSLQAARVSGRTPLCGRLFDVSRLCLCV